MHHDIDHPDRLVHYEIRSGARDRWMREEPQKAHRKTYAAGLPNPLADRTVQWMVPSAEWGSNLTYHHLGG
ncbi:hypothetical protein GEU84_015630 [Fertoebacter nigrum]|uniref:Uncharacterized protein n=1 Tax=Fertoeibacter niger TaxID=2656921 RepID=A0A8X8KP96_9RHOB|nr:hypothetical protein [Fertoeibacter niger]NUB45830.1 hypothetical protein [Fertoeibacter niger]